jgi:hypothetical protein
MKNWFISRHNTFNFKLISSKRKHKPIVKVCINREEVKKLMREYFYKNIPYTVVGNIITAYPEHLF